MVPADAGASLTHGFNYRFKLGAGVIRRDLDCRHRHPSHEQRTLGCSTYFRQPADALFWFVAVLSLAACAGSHLLGGWRVSFCVLPVGVWSRRPPVPAVGPPA